MTSTLFNRTLANRHTRASFRTLSKHAATGALCEDRALKLLRNNVRDVHPSATASVRQSIALQLLQVWRDGATGATHTTATEQPDNALSNT